MFKRAELMTIQAITPVHVGCGSDLGLVDLPIQREKHTGYPKIESSSIKGCIREAFEEIAKNKKDVYNVHNIFGYDSASKNCYVKSDKEEYEIVNVDKDVKADFKENDKFAGAIGFTDARILIFPVISAKDVFAYVTCPYVLNRFIDEFISIGVESKTGDNLKNFKNRINPSIGKTICSTKCKLKINSEIGPRIVIEEYTYKVEEDEKVNELCQALSLQIGVDEEKLLNKLIVVDDSDFRDFVTMNTEVVTRTKIDNETGTVSGNALFTEEFLPAETVMYSFVLYSPAFSTIQVDENDNKMEASMPVEKVMEYFKEKSKEIPVLQIGGDATIGKGIVKVNWGCNE